MKLKNLTIYDAKDAIMNLREEKLPVKISVKVNKTLKSLIAQYNFIEERRIELVKKYGTEKDGNIKVDPENIPEFQREYAELLSMEEEIEVRTISIDELPDSLEISSKDLELLSFIFEDE